MVAPLVIAHRGASATRPENTAAAFDAALAEGADGIELDLQLTRDDVVVVWHDRDLGRLGVPGVRLAECDWAWLATLDAGRWSSGRASTQRVLRLEQVLERWGQRTTLYLELKQYAVHHRQRRLARRVAALVRRYRLTQQVVVLSFHDGSLDAVGVAAPEIALVRNTDRQRGLAFACRDAARRYAVCVDIERFALPDVAPAHRAGLFVYAYTCDTPAQLRHAHWLEVAAVISNRPAAVLESADFAPT